VSMRTLDLHDLCSRRPLVEMCVCMAGLALALVMAGTGDLDALRVLREVLRFTCFRLWRFLICACVQQGTVEGGRRDLRHAHGSRHGNRYNERA
jgi:hypothetical protein